ncbi:MAG: 3'-5' exonuclease domain-containing protein 2 [Fibrobacteres bacterium]|nr:3'-5' exonuclease domain-containing protein 2 [Fibrobacterota bacterium]
MVEPLEVPSKEAIALLNPFSGLRLNDIAVPATEKEFTAAQSELLNETHVGFDTESKPTFFKGEQSTGPHIVQFATLSKAYIFQVNRKEGRNALISILQSNNVVKVGFGLKSDLKLIENKLAINAAAVIDLDYLFRKRGYRKEVGVKAGVAIVLNQRFQKPKSVTTSNWAQYNLKPNQLIYAANDAYAAIKVYHSL